MSHLNIVLKKLGIIVGKENVLSRKVDLTAYKDSVHLSGQVPSAVVFPRDTKEVSEVLKILNHYQIPCIPRGAGTNLCGDTLSFGETIILEMAKMDRILEVNILDRYIAVEPAVSNSLVQNALAPHGYFFAPDPASFGVSTIGGNIGENAGGMRCVKYGVTSDNVIGLEIVLSNGQIIQHKGPYQGDVGYDLTGLMQGSEGTFAVITKAWLRIMKLPEEVKTMVAVFAALDDSVETVSRIIGRGIIPSALEIIDHLAIQALEETRPMGYPLNAEAVLLIEVDGFAGTLDAQVERITAICRENHVSEIRIAKTEEERQLLWLGRREALNCFVSKRPTYAQEDVAVPRAKLPEMLNIIKEISNRFSLVVASVCHAGDGNFHPTIIYDEKDEEETKRAHLAFSEMMEKAVALGGTITGEHGVGVEKLKGMELLFSKEELRFMRRLKEAFDPRNILNPGKVIPGESEITLGGKGEDTSPISRDVKSTQKNIRCLNKVLEIDGGNLTATVEGGVKLMDLREMLREKGYILPVDPLETTTSAPIAELVQANSTGSLRLKYGTWQNLVLGLETLTAEGKIIKYGGKTIKNVAGYDLRKLFIGSWGTLGVIRQITLKIFPLPEESIYRTYHTEDYETFIKYIFALQRKDVQLTTFDIGKRENRYYVSISFSGPKESVHRQREILDELFKPDNDVGALNKLELLAEGEDPYLACGQNFYHKFSPQKGPGLVLKSSLLFSHIPEWIETMENMFGKETIILYGHAACGIVYAFLPLRENALRENIGEIVSCLKKGLPDGIHILQADPIISSAIEEINEGNLIEGNVFANGLNSHLKEIFDPQNLLVPGSIPGLFL